MVFKPASSGTPSADVYIARRRLNDAYVRDLFEIWKRKGIQILEQVSREQAGTFMKCMTQLMPRDFKVESSVDVVGRLSDEQLASMVAELEERIKRRLSGAGAKVINANVETDAAALPPPANEALCDTTGRRKRNPKSTPERLAYAREYKRQRKAGNPNAAAAARAAAQAAKTNK
jgi:hypothetical protein